MTAVLKLTTILGVLALSGCEDLDGFGPVDAAVVDPAADDVEPLDQIELLGAGPLNQPGYDGWADGAVVDPF